MNFSTARKLLSVILVFFSLFSARGQAGWELKQTPINDNLQDVRFFGNNGVVIGEKGIYYNTAGTDNPGLWKKYIIKTSATDSTLLANTKFVQLAFNDQAPVFYAIGNDTLQNRALLFRLNLTDSSYSFPFTGVPGTHFNSVAAVNYYYSAGNIVAVGNKGLMVSYSIAANTVVLSGFQAPADLKIIYSRSRYDNRAGIIANDSIFIGSAADNFSPDYGRPLGRHFTQANGNINYKDYFLDDQGIYNAYVSNSGLLSTAMQQYKPANLQFHAISNAVAGSVFYVATDKGIYKVANDNTLEYQPSSQNKSVNRIWFKQNAAFDTAYAVGNNGVLLKTVNLGGPVKPYAQLTGAIGSCVNSYYDLNGLHGSGTSCKWYLNGNFLQDFCGGSSYYFNAAGNYELKYIVNNTAGVSDTSTRIINITPKPLINLPFTISDSILCKAESVQVQINNTQAGHQYELIEQSSGKTFGYAMGNGSVISFASNLISTPGYYFIRSTNVTSNCPADFTNRSYIRVEKTRSKFSADKINVTVGEKFNIFNNSIEAQSFQWTFDQDPNINFSSAPSPQNIFYYSMGQKTLRLISTSANGCGDTLATNTVFVYSKPHPADNCYAVNIDDSDYAYIYTSYPGINGATVLHDNGYLLSGYGNKPFVKSRYGNSLRLNKSMSSYLVKYSEDGAIKWMHYIDTLGSFTGSTTDNLGNIYVIGYCDTRTWYHFNNGDSMQIAMTNTDTTYGSSLNGFILKLDSMGRYLWHTVFDDPSPNYQGYPVQGGLPGHITWNNGHISVTGSFLANLAYVHNDTSTGLYNLTNSTYSSDNQNSFLFRIRPDGSLAWKSFAHYNTTNSNGPAGIALDKNGNTYLVNDYENSVVFFDSDSVEVLNLTGITGYNRSFLLKIDSTGHMAWNAKIRSQYQYADNSFNHIVVDNAGSCYITGRVFNFGQYYPMNISNADGSLSISDTVCGLAIVKFSPNGMYKWSTGSRTPYYGSGTAITISGSDLYAGGSISNNGQSVANFTFTSINGVNYTDVFRESEFFIVHYDTNGVFRKIGMSGNNGGGHLEPTGLTLDSAGNFIVTGMADNYNGGNSSFSVFNASLNTNGIDAFFVKLNPGFCNSCPTNTWTGTLSSAWTEPANWSCNAVPGCLSNVIIPAGTPYSPIIASGQTSAIKSLAVQPGATLTVQPNGVLNVLH